MTVYVDLLFGLNTMINYLLLRGSAAIGGYPAKIWRLAAAAAVGGCYAVGVVLPGWELLREPVFQACSAATMVVLAFGWKRSTLKQGLFFLALSFAFGGVVLLAVQAAEPDCVILDGRAFYAVSTPALLLLAGACYAVAAVVLKGLGTYTGGDLVELELELDGRKTILHALRDTGNTLRDPMTGQQVLVAGRQVLRRLLPELQSIPADSTELLTRLSERYPHLRFRLVLYEAVGTENGMLPAVRCRIRTGKKQGTVLVAFSNTDLSAQGQFEALMGGWVI